MPKAEKRAPRDMTQSRAQAGTKYNVNTCSPLKNKVFEYRAQDNT